MTKFIVFTDTYSDNEAHVDPSEVGVVREGQDRTELSVCGLLVTVDGSLEEVLKAVGAATNLVAS